MLAFASAAVFSCGKENQEEIVIPAGEDTVVAVREGLDPATRTAVQPDGKSVWWNAGDKIMVFAGEGATGAVFTSKETSASKTASFAGTVGEASTYYGVYPADNASAVSAGGEISVSVPAVQEAVAGSFDGKAFPTVAKSESLTMTFCNVAGGIKFALSEEGVSEIVIKGNNNEDIAGTASVAFEGGIPVLKGITAGIKEITLTAPDGGFVPGNFYYAVLLPAELSKGLDITLRHSNGIPDSELVSAKARTIKRGTFGVLEGLNSIIASNGKVRFYINYDNSLRDALGLSDSGSWSMRINDAAYPVKTDANGRRYIEVNEAADKKYEAVLFNSGSSKWYGADVKTDVIVPMSQFWNTTKSNFTNYPRYASYSPETGNILTFGDAVAVINVKVSGSASISSVKVRSLGGKPVSGKASVQDGAFKLTESVDWAVVNCTDNGSFVSLPATVPVIIASGDYSAGLEITVCDSEHKMVRQAVYPGTLAAGQVYDAAVSWSPDSNLLFYEGFDNFVWGGDIIGGEGSTGYAPDDAKLTYTGGKTRDGYADAFTTVAYDYPGTGFIQSNTWNDVKDKTVGTSHIISDSYITSRNIADWKCMYRCQEYHGALGVGLEVNRGVVILPPLKGIESTSDIVLSFRFCLKDGCTDDLHFQLLYAGHVKNVTIDGKTADFDASYQNTTSNTIISRNNVTIPASAASKKEWHDCEIQIENITDATGIRLQGQSTKTADVHGFYLDEIKVTAIPGTDRKGNLKVLYWNIQDGMWADQASNYSKFVAWVKKYDPDVCVWCEAASVYKTGSADALTTSTRYFPNGWSEVAARYGHNYSVRGGMLGGIWAYPQVVTSKYPVSVIKQITSSNVSGCDITRGAGMFSLNFKGKTIDIVTGHMWPFTYTNNAAGGSTGEEYRAFEMRYILSQTVKSSDYASTTDWMLIGDFNSKSPLDIAVLGGSENDAQYLCQNVVLKETNLQDVTKIYYKADDFLASNYNATGRGDFFYVSPSLVGKIVNVYMLNDSWTAVNTKTTYGSTTLKDPSDHRPMIVEFSF